MSGVRSWSPNLPSIERIRVGLVEHFHVPVLAGVMAFMLWVRLQAYQNFLVGDRVYFNGNDAYYHFREVMYVVEHYPSTMPFDPWSYFPYGTSQGQFGTLFDQLIATAAMIVGLGSPSEHTVALVHLVAPAVFGALVVLPVYYIGARLGDRRSGIFAVVVLALVPGTFLARTTVGFPDHNSAEPLFQGLAIVGTVVALGVAQREKPVLEQVVDRDWSGLRKPLSWSLVAGLAMFLYVMVWPPAVFLLGLLGLFYAVTLSYDYVNGRSPEHVAFVGIVSMTVVFVLSLIRLDTLSFSTTFVSLLHPTLAAGIVAGCGFMAALGRGWERRSYPEWGFPPTVGVLILVGIGLTALLLPDLFGTIRSNVLRIFAFGQSDTVLTIREAQSAPFNQLGAFLGNQYGLAYVTAAVGLLWLVYRIYRSDEYSSVEILVVVWAVATTMMALTQVRFNYYLAVVVAVLNGYLIVRTLDLVDLRSVDDLRRVETYQVLIVAVVLMVAIVPLLPPIASPSAVGAAQQTGPGSSVVWGESLNWLRENTPEVGQYGEANNDLGYYGTFERTNDFAYPEGAYGVMSWWDYGHWITVLGHRIPNANPFQQGPVPASEYLQAANETRANLILDALPSLSDQPNAVADMSTAELQAVVANQSNQHASEDTRYVMIDDAMAGGKFRAIATWAGPASGPNTSFSEIYYSNQDVRLGDGTATLVGMSPRYEETMLSRLYFGDASGLSHYRLVHESGGQPTTFVSVAQQTQSGPRTVAVHRELTGPLYRAVQQRSDLRFYGAKQAAKVKTYERVEGATLTGTVPGGTNGTPVVAYVRLQTGTGRNFTYVQQAQPGADGSFAITVPYATDDAVSTAQGGTNASVRTLGEYTVQAGTFVAPIASGTVAVPEDAIYEGREIQVQLERAERENESTTGGNQSTDGDAPPSGSEDDSSGAGNQSSGAGNESAGSLAAGRETATVGP